MDSIRGVEMSVSKFEILFDRYKKCTGLERLRFRKILLELDDLDREAIQQDPF